MAVVTADEQLRRLTAMSETCELPCCHGGGAVVKWEVRLLQAM